jgi:hypothetical protein
MCDSVSRKFLALCRTSDAALPNSTIECCDPRPLRRPLAIKEKAPVFITGACFVYVFF